MKKPKITLDTVRELCLVTGFFVFGGGIWWIYPPAALIVCGALLVWIGLPAKGGEK